MRDEIDIVVEENGNIKTMYDSEIEKFVDSIAGSIQNIERASEITWHRRNNEKSGWVVFTSKKRSFMALRDLPDGTSGPSTNTEFRVTLFPTKEHALSEEIKFFWQLTDPGSFPWL